MTFAGILDALHDTGQDWQTVGSEYHVAIDASDLELSPGEWPETLIFDVPLFGVRTLFVFNRFAAEYINGDIVHVTYCCAPLILHVRND